MRVLETKNVIAYATFDNAYVTAMSIPIGTTAANRGGKLSISGRRIAGKIMSHRRRRRLVPGRRKRPRRRENGVSVRVSGFFFFEKRRDNPRPDIS